MNFLILVREPRGLCLSGMPMNTSEGRSDLCESWKLNLGILGLAQLEAMVMYSISISFWASHTLLNKSWN